LNKLHFNFHRDFLTKKLFWTELFTKKRYWPFDLYWPWVKVTQNLLNLSLDYSQRFPKIS